MSGISLRFDGLTHSYIPGRCAKNGDMTALQRRRKTSKKCMSKYSPQPECRLSASDSSPLVAAILLSRKSTIDLNGNVIRIFLLK